MPAGRAFRDPNTLTSLSRLRGLFAKGVLGPVSALITKSSKKVYHLRTDGRDHIKTINGRARRTKPHARACPSTTSKASDPRSELSRRHISANSDIDQRRTGVGLYAVLEIHQLRTNSRAIGRGGRRTLSVTVTSPE
jgi:hypothetical protein